MKKPLPIGVEFFNETRGRGLGFIPASAAGSGWTKASER